MGASRHRTGPLAALAVAVALVAVGCALDEAMPLSDCETGGSALLAAQSVPTAEYIPCLTQLPTGWESQSVRVDEDGMVTTLDSDRAGTSAARLHYAETCDIGDAVPMPSYLSFQGARRYDRVERLDPGFTEQRYYVFDGGCVWWEFDFNKGVSATLAVELGDRLVLVSRAELEEDVSRSFMEVDL